MNALSVDEILESEAFKEVFNYYTRVIIALFDPLYEGIVYVTNSLVDEERKVGVPYWPPISTQTTRDSTRVIT